MMQKWMPKFALQSLLLLSVAAQAQVQTITLPTEITHINLGGAQYFSFAADYP